jgi:uncharacterized protein (DUF1015 family)
MADFRAFKALRYNLDKTSLQAVIAPPYDVISPAGQDRLYEKSPFNCIRLILNKEEAGDQDGRNRYTRARDFLHEWIQQGTLIQEESAAFYLYRQTFSDLRDGKTKTRIAVFGRLKLEPFEKGIVIPHEKTLSKPKQDRLRLLQATETNLSAVFGLYEDPDEKIRKVLNRLLAQPSDCQAVDEENVRHELWVVRDLEVTDTLTKQWSAKNIYIADGHHRYQTALDYSVARRQKENVPEGKEMPYDSILMALVAFEDAGIVLYPTHRMVNLSAYAAITGETQAALAKLEPYFDIQPLAAAQFVTTLESAPQGKVQLGLLLGGKSWMLTLKDWHQAKQHMPAGKPDVWYQMDVAVLSHLVLGHLWGIPDSEWESVITYTHSDPEALAHAEKNHASAVFLLKAPRVQILSEMGRAGELMPQKSTYFYPKLASGLVFHSLTAELAVKTSR